MKVIMISGKSGSGKNALAAAFDKALKEKGNRVLTIAFGDLVKTFLKQYYGWNGEKDEAGRKLLQELGTEKVRTMFPTYWAEVVAEFIIATAADWDYVLIPDWRFANEYYTIADYTSNTILIRVERYNDDGSKWVNPDMTPEQLKHISENELEKFSFDYIVENRGEIDNLTGAAETILADQET